MNINKRLSLFCLLLIIFPLIKAQYAAVWHDTDDETRLNLYNNIVWNNNITNNILSSVATNLILEPDYKNYIDSDPLFMTPTIYIPSISSPVINNGVNAYNTLSKDINGFERLIEDVIDIGAYEIKIMSNNNYLRTRANGTWDSNIWALSENNKIWRATTNIPDINVLSAEIVNTITLPNGKSNSSIKTIIQNNGKLFNYGTFNINDTITFFLNNPQSSAQFLNNGTVINNGVVQIIKEFDPADGWSFLSFPFDVDKIINIETGLPATVGGLGDINSDVYILEYDGFSRDKLVSGDPNYQSSGLYWINVNPNELRSGKGYIMVTLSKKSIAFISKNGENKVFNQNKNISVQKFKTNTNLMHRSWNLIGNPYTSVFNMQSATQSHAPFYLFDGFTYRVAMPNDEDVEVYPFGSFFVQAHGAENNITFYSEGRLIKAAEVSNFDEISLVLGNLEYSDKVRIRLQEQATASYDLGLDAVKFMSPKTKVPQLYAITQGYNLAVNSMPIGTSKIDLGMYVGEKDWYSIKLSDVKKSASFKQVILEDKVTGKQIDLLASEDGYSFESSSVGTSKRFSVLLISEDSNVGIGNTEEDSIILIQTIGEKAYISGLEGVAVVNVYDIAGKLVQRFRGVTNGDALTINKKGLYVIKVNTLSQNVKVKVSIKK